MFPLLECYMLRKTKVLIFFCTMEMLLENINEYKFLEETLKRKIHKDDISFQRKNNYHNINHKTSDFITPLSCKKLMLQTRAKQDE